MDSNQKLFLGAAAIFLFLYSFRGWRLGPVRQLIGIIALLAAYADAYLFSAATVPFFHSLTLPNFVAQALGGLILAVITYVAVVTLGGVLFKKTTDQKSTLVWFVYGASGSLVGMILGLAIILAVVIVIRVLGTLADVPTKDVSAASPPTSVAAPSGFGASATPAAHTETLKPAVSSLVQMKHSLSQGVVGEALQTVDPIPKDVYVTLGKIGRVTSSTNAIARFLTYPGAKDLVNDPDIAALRNDPEITRAAQAQDLITLARNPKVVKACNNAKLSAKLKKLEFKKALDYALPEEGHGGE